MADEQNSQQQLTPKFSLDEFDIGVDDGSGEMVLIKREPKAAIPEENQQQDQNQSPETPQQPQFDTSVFDAKFSQMQDMLQRQNQVILEMGRRLAAQQDSQPSLESEQLGEVFNDPDKGMTFLNTLTGQIEKILNERLAPLQPVIQQNKLQQESNWLLAQPDHKEYLPAISRIIDINPGASLVQAYQYAKANNMKTPVQQTSQTQQTGNVSNINQRRNLPPPTNSSNAGLATREVKTVKDALELALEGLDFGT